MTPATGVLEVGPQRVVVHVMPRGSDLQLRRIIGPVLEIINAQESARPDGSGAA